jgi:N-acetylglucosamine kinase-like BadF-type ATPase
VTGAASPGRLLLGVDGGGTKTVALVADATGTVLGAGRAGSSDIHADGVAAETAVGEVASAVREATAAAGVQPADLGCCVFSLCGADWPEDSTLYADQLMERLALRSRPTVFNDAFGALRAGTPDGVGVALVLGTGAALGARGASGETWFTGYRIIASGAQEFGRYAYELLIRAEYGSDPAPSFKAAALQTYKVESVEDLVYAVTRSYGLGSRSLARLAPVLLAAGHGGDAVVQGYLTEHGRSLAGFVRSAAARVIPSGQRPRVVTSGGVFRGPGSELSDAIKAALPGFTVVASDAEPVYGAVMLAADEAGVRPDLRTMTRSGPGAGFFHTA